MLVVACFFFRFTMRKIRYLTPMTQIPRQRADSVISCASLCGGFDCWWSDAKRNFLLAIERAAWETLQSQSSARPLCNSNRHLAALNSISSSEPLAGNCTSKHQTAMSMSHTLTHVTLRLSDRLIFLRIRWGRAFYGKCRGRKKMRNNFSPIKY